MQYLVRPLTSEESAAIHDWRYEGRFATYEFNDGPPDAADGYFAVVDDNGLVGYCCYGAEARVPGVEAEPGTVDVGYGMHPDLVGHGRARPFIAAILHHAAEAFDVGRFRALVLSWNGRSLAACRNAGFEPTGEVTTDVGRFVILERPARPRP